MAVSESARHELYATLEGLIGKEHVETLMGLLPPVGWADVATKHDLAQIEERMNLRSEATDSKLEGMESRMQAMESRMESRMEAMESRINERIIRTALVVNIPTILASFALAFTAVRL